MNYKHKFAAVSYKFQPPVYEPLLHIHSKDVQNSDNYEISRDISLLFNQSRLDKLGETTLKDFLRGFETKSVSQSAQLSDDERFELIDSRYCSNHNDKLKYNKILENEYKQRFEVADRIYKSELEKQKDKKDDNKQ